MRFKLSSVGGEYASVFELTHGDRQMLILNLRTFHKLPENIPVGASTVVAGIAIPHFGKVVKTGRKPIVSHGERMLPVGSECYVFSPASSGFLTAMLAAAAASESPDSSFTVHPVMMRQVPNGNGNGNHKAIKHALTEAFGTCSEGWGGNFHIFIWGKIDEPVALLVLCKEEFEEEAALLVATKAAAGALTPLIESSEFEDLKEKRGLTAYNRGPLCLLGD